MKLFLDTNIIVDYILERGECYQQILQILSCAINKSIEVYASSLTIVNANYICVERNRTTKEEYKRKIEVLRPFLTITPITASDIYSSYDSQWDDFEDGVQYFSAKRTGCDYIVTRNEDDFERSEITVKNPIDMTELLYELRKSQLEKDNTIQKQKDNY